MPRAGDFREPVVFQRLGLAGNDGYGNVHEAWVNLFSDRGYMRETPGRESLAAGAIEATATAILECRSHTALAGITAADRVIARGYVWAIIAAPAQMGGVNRVMQFKLIRGVAV